ncbi:hypothetical protein [Methylotenera sp. L2L1]|uniref:hypothetical protein n=1 Tax=Methylotenera sp. L2L1 TaxID=1502770 RepID=UPI0005686DB5|nr:hypothetical protein [Methylotenera sp. L2L1]
MMPLKKLTQLMMRQQLSVLLIGAAVLIAIWIIYLQRGWVTSDSILYFEMARLIADGQWQVAASMFKWPFYPSLIALVHMVTGLSVQTSAQCLSVAFFATSLWALIKIVTQLGGNQRAQILATLMLFGSTYIVGDIMPMSTRDQGYWAFMLLALWQFIVLYKHGAIKSALAWQVLVLVATLFRIEGAVYILALPLVVLAFPKSRDNVNTIQVLFRAYVFFILLGILALLAVIMSNSINLDALGRLKELLTGFSDIEQNIKQNLIHRVDIMRDQVIGEPFKEFAWFTVLLSLFSISIIKCFFVAGWSPAILALSNTHQSRGALDKDTFKVLSVFAAITWVIACLIIFKVNILSGRYVVLFGFVLIAVASVTAEVHLQQWKHATFSNRAVLVLCATIVLVGFISNVLPKRDGYHYEINAVEYVQQSLVDSKQQAVLYTSEKQRFYAQKPYEDRNYDEWQYLVERIEDGRVNQYEFVVINLNLKADSAAKEVYLQTHLTQFKQDKVFYGHKKKKRTFVYRRIH